MNITANMLRELLANRGIETDSPPASLEDCPPEYLSRICPALLRLYQWDSDTNLAIAQGCTFQTLMDLTEPILGNPAIIFDYSTRVNAHTRIRPDNDPIFDRTVALQQMPPELIENLITDVGQIFPQAIEDRPVIVEHKVSEYPEVICQVKVNHRYVAYLYLQCAFCPLTDGMMDFIAQFTEKLQMLAARENGPPMGLCTNSGSAERLLSQIAQGMVQGDDVICAAARRNGLPTTGTFQLYLISDANRKLDILCSSFDYLFADAKFFRCDSFLLILALYVGKHRSPEIIRQSLERHLDGWLTHVDVQSGVSRSFSSLSQLPTAYRQALEAYEMAVALRERQGAVSTLARTLLPRGRIARFEDLQLHILLCKYGADRIADLCEPFLMEILKNDKRNGSDVFKVFFTYILLGRKTNDAAAMLHMHRNTIVYRVNRICERFSLNLDDELVYQRLIVSFAALELLE